MQIKDITELFEKLAPNSLQEDYDNAGLIIGNQETEITGILLSLDATEAVIDEAISNGCNLVISHHPVIFKGLKKINGQSYVERTVIKAIRHNIALFAVHTNLDNVLHRGVNEKIAQKIGLKNLRILRPKNNTLSKLIIYGPSDAAEIIKECLFKNGAGTIGNYSECSFSSEGTGSFKPNELAKPFKGIAGARTEDSEVKIEVMVQNHQVNALINAVKNIHPYEEMAYDVHALMNSNPITGSGVYGFLDKELNTNDFLNHLKDVMQLEVIRYTAFGNMIRKVAVCGGSGSFLISDAKAAGADAYVSADIKYHEFFDTENQMLLCDIGHYESEIYTLEIFYEVIKEKYPTFAVIFCKENTNPIQYFK